MSRTSYFTDDSLLRRVHREKVAALSGPRALLMMGAHPVAFEGFFMATGSLDDPYDRLRRTAEVMDAIAWGPKADADRMTARVRAMHARARGTLPRAAGPFPAGTPWAADDPALLLWIVACLVDSAVLVHERYVERLTPSERDAYWADYRVVGRLFGLADADMPQTWADFQAYMSDMLGSGDLVVTPTARQVGIEVVLRPPVPLKVRPLVELANFVTVGLLPGAIRRGYGFSWDPARALAVRGGAEYVKRVLVPLLPGRLRYVASAGSSAAA
ncbi:MAG TPA: oxygenase MpaB family protein [Baekduia sp.]|uniref:oxygenase MpaB family protein n=1 Tax=Baekduia sp. TaxID=2600305 RepID=UPI002CF1849A|nr:oxygenase MpaB family protein [Baekduia sp.]HMJ33866.1 oxygenase MpaB family protein [Baekduia sp.]